MSISVQHRRGTTAAHETFTGKIGELTVDTTKDTVVVHDGSTAGGHPLATEAYTDNKIEEAFDALTAADVPTSDSSDVQTKLTSYSTTLNSHATTLGDHTTQLIHFAN